MDDVEVSQETHIGRAPLRGKSHGGDEQSFGHLSEGLIIVVIPTSMIEHLTKKLDGRLCSEHF